MPVKDALVEADRVRVVSDESENDAVVETELDALAQFEPDFVYDTVGVADVDCVRVEKEDNVLVPLRLADAVCVTHEVVDGETEREIELVAQRVGDGEPERDINGQDVALDVTLERPEPEVLLE